MVEVGPGELFLGGELNPETGERTSGNVLYESHQFTTHGVIVGMTGSGKTGLGLIVLEEALLQNIPALIIDPKGDMGNLLLNFPNFAPSDFRPWIDEGEAQRKGDDPDTYAASQASLWEKGLGGWGIDASRMQRLKDSSTTTIYTPGSNNGVPLNVVGNLTPPDLSWETHAEVLRDEIEAFVSSLLLLAGVEADPISSPEHILLSTIIERSWQAGQTLDLATLIGQIQTPPIRKLGVFELDTFFPPKDRMKLAMKINGLIASPSFSSWLEGDPIDMDELLYAPDGSPRAAVVNIAHLSDTERQFIVTLLYSKLVTWMRKQQGSSQLRAIAYMDEVFGFCPPTAEPPSKKPILTLLKQARAYGVGLLLSTQNPVDLDYKAMSNAGTWMVGRLQTERDKARIVEALKSASGEVDVKLFDRLISGLGKREFVLHSTRSSQPTVFTTRWAMSYLAGPLSRDQIARLTKDDPARPATAPAIQPSKSGVSNPPDQSDVPNTDSEVPLPPVVADGTNVYHLSPSAPWASAVGADRSSSRFEAALVARVKLTFDDRYAELAHDEEWEAVFTPLGSQFDPGQAVVVDYDDRDFVTSQPVNGSYVLPDLDLKSKQTFISAAADLKDWLARNQKVEIFRNATLKLYSRIGESETDFGTRCSRAADDAADQAIAALKKKYATRIKTVQSQLSTAERRVQDLAGDVAISKQSEMISGAGDLLSAVLGGRRRSPSLRGVASRRSATRKKQVRFETAQDKVAEKMSDLVAIEDDLEMDVLEITGSWQQTATEIELKEVALEKTDIRVEDLAVLWVPTP
jgi:hypothetical protein